MCVLLPDDPCYPGSATKRAAAAPPVAWRRSAATQQPASVCWPCHRPTDSSSSSRRGPVATARQRSRAAALPRRRPIWGKLLQLLTGRVVAAATSALVWMVALLLQRVMGPHLALQPLGGSRTRRRYRTTAGGSWPWPPLRAVSAGCHPLGLGPAWLPLRMLRSLQWRCLSRA